MDQLFVFGFEFIKLGNLVPELLLSLLSLLVIENALLTLSL